MSAFLLIAGLGNPGSRFTHNRHNIGFRTVDALAKDHHLTFSRTEHHTSTAHGMISGERVILAKPQTFMNASGKAIGALTRYYKIPPQHLLVIYDDLDLPLGTVRFRQEGSSGGHRGVQSIINHLSTSRFPRLRLGIGRPPGRMDPADYVLQDFSAEEQPLLWEVLRMAKDLAEKWIAHAPIYQNAGMTWQVDERH
ncbi:MAG: aminoacyl-tRNA hydrolase [Anaerolineae bacterium]